MDSSFWFGGINFGWSIVCIERSHVILIILINCIYLKIVIVLANSADPDKMLHCVAFYLSLHCLQNNAFKSQKKIFKLLV